jgi:hypothetical protein
MTVKMSHPKQNRKFRSPPAPVIGDYKGKIFLVYTYEAEADKIVSEGTYHDNKEAKEWMEKLLAEGACAWIVSYNG